MRAAEIGQTKLYSLHCLETNKQTIKFTINKIEKLYNEYKAYKARYTSDINFKQIIWITVWGEQMAHCFEFVTFSKYMF